MARKSYFDESLHSLKTPKHFYIEAIEIEKRSISYKRLKEKITEINDDLNTAERIKNIYLEKNINDVLMQGEMSLQDPEEKKLLQQFMRYFSQNPEEFIDQYKNMYVTTNVGEIITKFVESLKNDRILLSYMRRLHEFRNDTYLKKEAKIEIEKSIKKRVEELKKKNYFSDLLLGEKKISMTRKMLENNEYCLNEPKNIKYFEECREPKLISIKSRKYFYRNQDSSLLFYKKWKESCLENEEWMQLNSSDKKMIMKSNKFDLNRSYLNHRDDSEYKLDERLRVTSFYVLKNKDTCSIPTISSLLYLYKDGLNDQHIFVVSYIHFYEQRKIGTIKLKKIN